jgi:hypothetical protein
MDYTFTQNHLAALNNALLEIPGKYGFPIIQLVNRIIAEQTKPAIVEPPKVAAAE